MFNERAPLGQDIDRSHGGSAAEATPKGSELKRLDEEIEDRLTRLEKQGVLVEKWWSEYDKLPYSPESLESFMAKLLDFTAKREEALIGIEFVKDVSEEEKSAILQFDHEVRASYGNPENFLGNGATAEVYAMNSNETICVKFVTNQDRYNENNHLRVEFDFLSTVYEQTKDSAVRTPYPVFRRIHAREGHSYGMEKIPGASLSQIIEFPEKYESLLQRARTLDRSQVESDLLDFVAAMHQIEVVHGDLYKRNIMLGEDGRVFVIDFGKAKDVRMAVDREERMRSDIYSVKHSLREFFDEIDKLTN